jgi:hypothetical protein
MNRRNDIALGIALALGTAFAAAGCGQTDAGEEAPASVSATSQTTDATLPVVTVYKSPT